MDHMVKIPGTISRDQVLAGMAYFAGTGPIGATCGTCVHRGYKKQSTERWSDEAGCFVGRVYRVTKCALYRAMTGEHGHNIDADYPACKYYEAKPENAANQQTWEK